MVVLCTVLADIDTSVDRTTVAGRILGPCPSPCPSLGLCPSPCHSRILDQTQEPGSYIREQDSLRNIPRLYLSLVLSPTVQFYLLLAF
jgi:hypothetical protein